MQNTSNKSSIKRFIYSRTNQTNVPVDPLAVCPIELHQDPFSISLIYEVCTLPVHVAKQVVSMGHLKSRVANSITTGVIIQHWSKGPFYRITTHSRVSSSYANNHYRQLEFSWKTSCIGFIWFFFVEFSSGVSVNGGPVVTLQATEEMGTIDILEFSW